jgi:hypothetical protein
MSESKFRALCAELTEELALLDEPPHELVNRAQAELAAPSLEPPTDEELVAAFAAGIAAFPPQHPDAKHLSVVEYEVELEVRKARAVLERCG